MLSDNSIHKAWAEGSRSARSRPGGGCLVCLLFVLLIVPSLLYQSLQPTDPNAFIDDAVPQAGKYFDAVHADTVRNVDQQVRTLADVLLRRRNLTRVPLALQMFGTVRSLLITWPTIVSVWLEPLYELTGEPAHVFAVFSVFDGRACDLMSVDAVFGTGPKNWSTDSYRLCDVHIERQSSEQALLRWAVAGIKEPIPQAPSHLRGVALVNERRVAFQQRHGVRYDMVAFSRTDTPYELRRRRPFPWADLLERARTTKPPPAFVAWCGTATGDEHSNGLVLRRLKNRSGFWAMSTNIVGPPFLMDVYASAFYRLRELLQRSDGAARPRDTENVFGILLSGFVREVYQLADVVFDWNRQICDETTSRALGRAVLVDAGDRTNVWKGELGRHATLYEIRHAYNRSEAFSVD